MKVKFGQVIRLNLFLFGRLLFCFFSFSVIACDVPDNFLLRENPSALSVFEPILIYDGQPTLRDLVDFGGGALFNGQWYYKDKPSLDLYSGHECLAIANGGELATVSNSGAEGKIPLLPGGRGFYVEVVYKISDNGSDHWPAIWLMPVEHDGSKRDRIYSDPEGYERWFELDVDEGGFGRGITATAHSWTGVWPKYNNLQNPNNVLNFSVNRSVWHSFAALYLPKLNKVQWFYDYVLVSEAGYPYVPHVAFYHNYYIIFSAQNHGGNVPYHMKIGRIREYALE